MWEHFGTSPIAITEFWDLKCSVLPEPRTKNATSPLRKLFNMFNLTPQRSKLPLFLIYHALNHPMMIFYGLGIFACKKMVNSFPTGEGRRPSEQLTSACKLIFRGLQEDHPKLFGNPDQVEELFNRHAVVRVIATLFVNNSKVKKKREIARHDAEADIDEVCILDNIARYLQGTQGLTTYRSQMRTYLRETLVKKFFEVNVFSSSGKMSSERNVRLKKTKAAVIEKLSEYLVTQENVEDELKSSGKIDDVTEWLDYRNALIGDLVDSIPVIDIDGVEKVNRQCQIDAISCLFSPRQVLTSLVWKEAMRQVVVKLPGGKINTRGPGGAWLSRRFLYYEQPAHQADVIMYMVLLVLAQDCKLVQYMITGPEHMKDSKKIHKLFLKIVKFDQLWHSAMLLKHGDDYDPLLHPLCDIANSRRLKKLLLSRR
jgi:hypothetical protein